MKYEETGAQKASLVRFSELGTSRGFPVHLKHMRWAASESAAATLEPEAAVPESAASESEDSETTGGSKRRLNWLHISQSIAC